MLKAILPDLELAALNASVSSFVAGELLKKKVYYFAESFSKILAAVHCIQWFALKCVGGFGG